MDRADLSRWIEAYERAWRTPGTDALQGLFDELSQSAFTFVVIHAPPLLEPEGCRAWARHVDALLVVSRLEKMSPNDLLELRDQLEQVETVVLGHVVLGRGGRRA